MDFTSSQKGDKYKNFSVTKSLKISELNCHLIELEHNISGARVMAIVNEDPENLFCLSFKTIPESSNGVAHILEHTVLCGSEKFPVRDPFFSMTRRSLNTYMNALTGEDFTCYPAASQVEQDFYNLLDVYMDAVFHPKLHFQSFLQEGHRLEFSEEGDKSSPLLFKGIVYNEMKGAMMSPASRIHEALYAALFPNVTYGLNSGGEPRDIPNLTYEELKEFHNRYYHPSRCLYFFYGNLPLTKHLDYIAEGILDSTEKADPLPPIPRQKRFETPVKINLKYPLPEDEPQENQTFISFGWLTTNVLDQELLLALCILDMAITETDASPLKMAFLKSGMCSQISAYVDPDINEVPFVISLKGCNPKNADALEKLLFNTLQNIVAEGIPDELIKNAMHQLEFHRSETTGDHCPFGLTLFMRSALIKQHGAHPEEGLMIHDLFKRLHKSWKKNPKYFEDLIQKFFIDNKHFARIVMEPDYNLEAKELEEESKTLQKIKSQLSESEADAIIQQAEDLKQFQREQDHEDPDILPKIHLSDVDKNTRDYPLRTENIHNITTFHHDCFTNSICYADLIWDLPKIPEDDFWLIRLYAVLIAQLGCGGRSYSDNLNYIQANVGELDTSLSLNISANDCRSFKPSIHIRGKSLYRNAEKLFTLIRDSATTVDLSDRSRLKEVFFKHFSGLQSSLTQGALKYAISLAASGINPASRLNNKWFGTDYYTQVKKYAQSYDSLADELYEKLVNIQKLLTEFSNPHLIIGCDQEMYEKLKKENFYGLSNISIHSRSMFENSWIEEKVPSQAKIIASPVAFTSKVFNAIPYCHPDAPALSIAANLFDNLTLHRALREQGGAYGGGASFNSLSGNFLFYSFRDPNIFSTLNAFDDAVDKVLNGDFGSRDLEEAILEKIQGIDAPVSPGSRAELAYSWWKEDKSLEMRQSFRESLLSMNKEQVISAVSNHIFPKMNEGTTVIFSGKELIDRENKLLIKSGKQPLIVTPI
ncbi:MAG: insulinase family protein [Chlamydiota bacterium]|nr:insulinase family protein [Chlamydiota bacterium]